MYTSFLTFALFAVSATSSLAAPTGDVQVRALPARLPWIASVGGSVNSGLEGSKREVNFLCDPVAGGCPNLNFKRQAANSDPFLKIKQQHDFEEARAQQKSDEDRMLALHFSQQQQQQPEQRSVKPIAKTFGKGERSKETIDRRQFFSMIQCYPLDPTCPSYKPFPTSLNLGGLGPPVPSQTVDKRNPSITPFSLRTGTFTVPRLPIGHLAEKRAGYSDPRRTPAYLIPQSEKRATAALGKALSQDDGQGRAATQRRSSAAAGTPLMNSFNSWLLGFPVKASK